MFLLLQCCCLSGAVNSRPIIPVNWSIGYKLINTLVITYNSIGVCTNPWLVYATPVVFPFNIVNPIFTYKVLNGVFILVAVKETIKLESDVTETGTVKSILNWFNPPPPFCSKLTTAAVSKHYIGKVVVVVVVGDNVVVVVGANVVVVVVGSKVVVVVVVIPVITLQSIVTINSQLDIVVVVVVGK